MKKAFPWFFACLAGLIFFTSVPLSFAQQERLAKGPTTIEAESISYDRDMDTYLAKGQVNIAFPGGTLTADSVLLERSKNHVTAEGRVTIKTDSDVLEGDKIDFDIAANTGTVYAGNMFVARNHFYIKGKRIEKTGESAYRIIDASVTACDGDSPDWRLTGRQLDVTVDGYGTVRDGKFYAKDIPLLYVPYMLFPAKTTRQTGLLFPYLAYSRDKLGMDVELPLYLVISKSADATLYQRYMDKRGFKEGAELRYTAGKDSYGVLYGDYLSDQAKISESKGDISRDWQSPQNRWSFYLQQYTAFQPDLYLRADIAKVSDNWYFKDFASHNYYLDHYSQNSEEQFKKIAFVGNESLGALDSKVRLVKDWSLYNLTALFKYTDDLTSSSNDSTLQKYPEITLAGAKQSLPGVPLDFVLGATLSGNYRGEGQKGGLLDLNPIFSLPLNMGGNVLQLTPAAEFRGIFWDREDNNVSADRRGSLGAYKLGANLASSLFRDYTLAGESVEKIRHEIRPELSYAYIPHFGQDDLPDFAEKIEEKNAVSASLTNTIMAKVRGKDGKASYMELLRFKLSQSYDIIEARREAGSYDREKRPFGDIDMELDLRSVQYVSLSARNRYNANSGVWEKTNYDLSLSDQRGDSATIGYHYTQDVLEEINFLLKALLTKSLDVSYELRKNKFDHVDLRNTISFNFRRQCWSAGVSYADDDTDKRVMLTFSLTGIGSAGGK